MAFTIWFVLFVFLVRAVLSLPVSQDIKSVLSSRTQERTFVIDRDKILKQFKDSEKVQSLDGVASDESVKRTKREIIVGNNSCAEGEQWILNGTQCVTQEQYDELKADDYDEIETTTHRSHTTHRSLTARSPRMTRPPRTTRPPLTTSHVPKTPSPVTTPCPQTSPSPPKNIELSSGGSMLTLDLRLFPFLFFILFFVKRNY